MKVNFENSCDSRPGFKPRTFSAAGHDHDHSAAWQYTKSIQFIVHDVLSGFEEPCRAVFMAKSEGQTTRGTDKKKTDKGEERQQEADEFLRPSLVLIGFHETCHSVTFIVLVNSHQR